VASAILDPVSRVGDDFVREREELRNSLRALGPDAPTACGSWTTTDLAAHIAVGELRGGVPVVPFRLLVARGVRIDRMARVNAAGTKAYGRRGFDWAIKRLDRPPPRAHLWSPVVAVSLLEVWAHHEDVLQANDLAACASGIDLTPVIALLRRYQRKRLREVPPFASARDEALFLAGRTAVDGTRLSI